ncbi:MAG TPA: hypothetical protein VKC60_01520, partial [Opitutaceae bacterium]|nr:hypothetical protein [Opitutaceae bacterium]
MVEERTIRPEEIGTFQECFLLSSTRDITPVVAIDGVGFDIGPDALLRTLKKAFEAYALTYADTHISQKI